MVLCCEQIALPKKNVWKCGNDNNIARWLSFRAKMYENASRRKEAHLWRCIACKLNYIHELLLWYKRNACAHVCCDRASYSNECRILIWILLLYIYLVNILQIAMSTRVDRGRFRLVDCELRIPCIYDMCDCTHVYVYAYMVCVHAIEQAIYVPV